MYMSNDIRKNLAVNLKNLIGNMTISEFAKKVDIPQQTISRYLLFQREISLRISVASEEKTYLRLD